jgi:error-prone DNA polymerase
MIAEYRMLRFSAELHPLTLLEGALPSGTVASDRLTHLRQGSTVRVAGLVTTRQRPQTAKGYVFVLMEDEHGPINVIVKPDVYKRDRSAVRMEPFLAVRGRLQKDGATLNVIAHEVEALRVGRGPKSAPRPGHAPAHRRGRSWAAAPIGSTPTAGAAMVRERADDLHELHDSLPDTLEYWADPDEAEPTEPAPNPFGYLTALRQSPPGIKSFG